MKRCILFLLFVVLLPCLASGQVKGTRLSGNNFATNTDLSTVAATATQTSSPFVNAGFFKQAEIYIGWASTAGSPSGCTLQVEASPDGTNFFASGTAITLTPGTNAVSVFTGAMGWQVKYVYACSAYPSAGTLTVETVYK